MVEQDLQHAPPIKLAPSCRNDVPEHALLPAVVHLRAEDESRVRLTTGTGMISAGFTAPPREIFATSGIGSVDVRVPSGSAYRVTASSQTGSVLVSVHRAAASSHVLQASTGTGTVTVAGN